MTSAEPVAGSADLGGAASEVVAGLGAFGGAEAELAGGLEPPPGEASPLPRDIRFRRFWLGETISQLGDRVSELALPLIAVATLRADATAAATLAAATWTPNLLGVFLGAWVDRQRRKRRLMIVADLARAAILLSLPIAAAFHAVGLGQL